MIERHLDLRPWGGPVAELDSGPDTGDRSRVRRSPVKPSRGEVVVPGRARYSRHVFARSDHLANPRIVFVDAATRGLPYQHTITGIDFIQRARRHRAARAVAAPPTPSSWRVWMKHLGRARTSRACEPSTGVAGGRAGPTTVVVRYT